MEFVSEMRLSRPQNLALQLQPGWPIPRTITSPALIGSLDGVTRSISSSGITLYRYRKLFSQRIPESPMENRIVLSTASPRGIIGLIDLCPPAVAGRGVGTRRLIDTSGISTEV